MIFGCVDVSDAESVSRETVRQTMGKPYGALSPANTERIYCWHLDLGV